MSNSLLILVLPMVVGFPIAGFLIGSGFDSFHQPMDESFVINLPVAEPIIEDVWAEEQSYEGFKYKVELIDGIGSTDYLR